MDLLPEEAGARAVQSDFPDISQKPWVMTRRTLEIEIQTDGSWKQISEAIPVKVGWPDYASFMESSMRAPCGKGL
jgi:hypothetical protein